MLDDNTTSIIIALISLITTVVTLVFSYLASSRAQKAIDSSLANSGKIEAVSKAVDGLTTARVQSATDLGDAKAEVARAAGRDEERGKQEAIATGIAAGAAAATAAAASTLPKPVEVKVVEAAPVAIKESIPLEIKEKSK